MTDFDILGGIGGDSDECVFLDGSGKYSVSLIVDMLSDDIDSSGCSGDEVRFISIYFCERIDDRVEPAAIVGGVEGVNFL